MPEPAMPSIRTPFVLRDGCRFLLDGRPYRFVGANLYYAAWLGMGNRERLTAELDLLAGLGVRNLRIMGSAEASALKRAIRPAFHDREPPYNEDLLRGLDVVLAEMAARKMKAVLCLSNAWEWSGGFMAYLGWTQGGRILDRADGVSADAYADLAAGFFCDSEALALYRDYIAALAARTNTVTRKRYRDDPTIMSWQLANEPRPAASLAPGLRNLPSFYAWIAESTALLKEACPNHLVSLGSEGLHSSLYLDHVVTKSHAIAGIDYMTVHTWPQNWGWADPNDLLGTYAAAELRSRNYLRAHVALATELAMPLVAEEFGFPRDNGFEPGTPTTFRDRFYAMMLGEVEASVRAHGPLQGANFWAWGGTGRAPQRRMAPDSTDYLGDPPHEPQGWYSVFDTDESTLTLIKRHATQLAALG